MADTIFTSQTPSSTDSGGATDRNLGIRFQVSSTGYQVSGGRVWVPAAGLAATAYWQLWDTTGPTKLAEVDLHSLPTPTNDAWMNVPLVTPVTLTAASHDYIVSNFMSGTEQYVFENSGSFPIGTGVVSADTAIYNENGGINGAPIFTGFSGYFFADVNVDPVSVAVGTASEVDTALSILVDVTVDVNIASEVDTALDVNGDVTVDVGTASEIDSAFGIGVEETTPVDVGVAAEVDAALSIGINLTVPVDTANEVDLALSIGSSGGGGVTPDGDLSATYYLNMLAGTIVNGVPTLTAKAAADVWAAVDLTISEVEAYNVEAGNLLPNWLAIQGVLNQIAGTENLSAHDALIVIVGA